MDVLLLLVFYVVRFVAVWRVVAGVRVLGGSSFLGDRVVIVVFLLLLVC